LFDVLCVLDFFFFIFFFSSRRRHTIFSRDWSSDVCSSDLFVRPFQDRNANGSNKRCSPVPSVAHRNNRENRPAGYRLPQISECRSEERRVGKELRSQWGRY